MKDIKLKHSVEDIRGLFSDWNNDTKMLEILMALMERVDVETWAFIEAYAIFNMFAGIYYAKVHSSDVEIVTDPLEA